MLISSSNEQIFLSPPFLRLMTKALKQISGKTAPLKWVEFGGNVSVESKQRKLLEGYQKNHRLDANRQKDISSEDFPRSNRQAVAEFVDKTENLFD